MRERLPRIGLHAVLSAASLAMVAPFAWQIITSLKSLSSATAVPPTLLPEGHWSNYGRVFDLLPFGTQFLNTLLTALLRTAGQVLFCSMAAYAFARLRFWGRDGMFLVYLSALMVPGIVMTIPNFILVKEAGLLNTFLGIMAPTLLMTPFAVFFLRQFFLSINKELEEAAFLDGAGKVRTFVQIILPMSQTALATLALSTFIAGWNDYLWPLLVGKNPEVRLLNVAMGIFRSQTPQGVPDWGGLMAGALISIVPLLVLFALFGKRIVNSISFSGFR